MLDDLQLDPDRVPLYKLIFHIIQIVVSFIAWVLEIVVFRSKGAITNGQSGWAFGVCFLSIPAWIYLIGAPRYPRTRRFAEPHVMVAVDVLFVLLWLSAFASQAAYNSAGHCGSGCGTSKAVVAMGVFNTLFFCVTAFLSIYSLTYYKLNGFLPGYDRAGLQGGGQNIDPDRAAFSTAPHDEEPYARINNMDPDYDNDYSEMGGYAGASTVGGGYAGSSTVSSGYAGASTVSGATGSHMGTSYLGAGSTVSGSDPFDDPHGVRPAASNASLGTSYAPPTVHDAYDDGRPVRFPEADYERH